MKHSFFILSFLTFPFAAMAQVNDSTLFKSESSNGIALQEVKTDSLFGFNFLQQDFYQSDLGNPGSTKFNLAFKSPDFAVFESSQMFSRERNEFFYSETPTTFVSYSLGSNKSQEFYLRHVQKLSKRTYSNLIYQKTRSEGFYTYQLNNIDRIKLNLWTSDRNRLYEIAFQGQYDGVKRQENGGLNDDSLFSIAEYSNPKLYQVFYTDGTSKLYNWHINLNQDLNFLKITTKLKAGLSHQFSYRYNFHEYNGFALNGYYTSIFKDSTLTIDKSEIEVFTNDLAFRLRSDSLDIKLGYSYAIQQFNSPDSLIEANQSNLFFNATIVKPKWELNTRAKYYLDSYFSSDYFFHTNFMYKPNQGFFTSLDANVLFYSNRPRINESFYSGNHYQWNNDFSSVNNASVEVGFNHKEKLSLHVNYTAVSNYIYLDSTAIMNQFNGGISVLQAKLDYRILIWKHLNVYINSILQYTGNDEVVRVPALLTNASVFYTGHLWAMQINTGVNINYYSAYQANSFSPNLNSYFLQNGFYAGNYPMLDVFFESRIKTVKLFLAVNHITEGLFGRNYFIAQNFPMVKRFFRFGVSWNFFN